MSGQPPQGDSLNVLFAIQSGGAYGQSHMARAKVLAHALEQDFNAKVTLWIDSQDLLVRNQLVELGFNVIQQQWSLQETLRRGSYNRLVIDFESPVTPSMMGLIRSAQPDLSIIVIDNTGLGTWESDALIFPNVHVDTTPWEDSFQGQLYQGMDYVVFGELFQHRHRSNTEAQESSTTTTIELSSLLVTIGSTDVDEVSEHILEALRKIEVPHIDFIVPPMYPNPEALEKIATRSVSPLTMHWQIRGLKSMIKPTTSMALCGFGISAYELAYAGIPLMVFAKQESQLKDLERFCDYGFAVNIGLGSALDEAALRDTMVALQSDKYRLTAMTERGQTLFKQNGPERIARIILETSRTRLSV